MRDILHPIGDPPVEVTLRGITQKFGAQVVFSDLNLDVQPGEIFVLMGPSGVGKSVLLKLIAGLQKPTAGEIYINGMPIQEARKKWTIALVFQSGALFNSMDVFDNLALYPREHRLGQEKEIGSRVATILDMLSLGDATHKMPSELSGGMRKRVAIARGLIMNPHLFLYDEPTSELDPVTGASVIEIIALVNRKFKTTTVVVSHDSKLAFSIGTHVTFLHDGRLAQVTVPSNSSLSSDPVMGEFLNPTIDPENPRFKKSSPPL